MIEVILLSEMERDALRYYLKEINADNKFNRWSYHGILIGGNHNYTIKQGNLELQLVNNSLLFRTDNGETSLSLNGDAYLFGEKGYYKIDGDNVSSVGNPEDPKLLIRRYSKPDKDVILIVVPLEFNKRGYQKEVYIIVDNEKKYVF